MPLTRNEPTTAKCSRPGARPAWRVASAVLLLALTLLLPGTLHAYIIINAPMTDTNASGWVLGGNPASAYLTGTGGASPAYDPVGQGWLRLTNTNGNQTGFAYNTTSFDLSAGVLIQFDYAAWGGSGADGTSVFLFDSDVPTFNIGAFGGSLGYAQKMANNPICNGGTSVSPAVPGVSGGYVGIGIDEYGNYAACTEGRFMGWNTNSSNLDANTITVRGTVVGFGGGAVGSTLDPSSYPWVATSSSTTGYGGLYTGGGTSRPSQTGTGYRKVMIQISPAPNPVLNAWVQFGYNTIPVQVVSNQSLPTISPSQTLRVGFGASTGGANNYHDVRNLLITSLGQSTSIDLGITKVPVTTGTSTQIANANLNSSFQYLLTATNNGPNDIYASGVGVTDIFPSNLTAGSWTCSVVTAGSSTGGATSCGAASGSGNINTTVNLTKGGSVAFRVNATVNSVPIGNSFSNTASLTIPGAITDFYPGNDSVTATINSYSPLTVTKAFSPATVTSVASTSVMTVTLSNPNNIPATGVTFTDTYPTGLTNATTPAASTTCGGTVSATGGGSTLRLTGTGNTIPANGSCTASVTVKGATLGATYTNTISAGAIATTATALPSNTAAATATFTAMSPPTVAKSFTPNQVGVNLPSSVNIAITNPDAVPITGAAFTDSYPANLFNTATPAPTITGTGCSGTLTATAGGSSLVLTGGTIPANTTCTFSASVSAANAGTYTNRTPAVTTTNTTSVAAGTNVNLVVLNPPTITKAFASPGTILPGGTSVMTVTLTNPNATAITGASFSDTYPAGLFNTAALNDATTCTGGTTNSTNGATGGTLSLSGATIPANGSCTVTVTTTSPTAGSYTNSTGAVTTTNAGTGSSASGTLVVMATPTVTKSFSPNSVNVGSTSVMSVVLTNPNAVAITGAAFTDGYPSGLQNTASAGAAITGTGCSGTLTAANNGTSLKLATGVIPANASCTITVNTTITSSNTYTNTIAAGAVTTTNAGSNAVAASATLNGPQPPTIAKVFGTSSMATGGTTSMTLTIGNTNGVPITLTSAFTDTFPAGMTIATAGNTGTCTGVTAGAGAGSLTMANGTSIPVGGCTIVVSVTSSTAGTAVDTIAAGALQTSMGNNQTAVSASLAVYAPPTVTKAFSPASVSYGGSSTMTITVTNPSANPGNITGVALSDSYVGGLTNTAAGSVACSGGGSATLSGGGSGGNSVGFTAGTIVPGGTCTITQSVSATASYANTTAPPTATGPAALTGTGASATLTVAPIAPTVAEDFAATNLPTGGTTTLTVTLGNANAGAIALTSAFTDVLPAGMTIGTAGSTGTCGGVTATAGSTSFTMASGSTIPTGGCTIIVNIVSSGAGSGSDTIAVGDLQTTAGNNTVAASDTVNVYAPPTVTKTFSPASIPAGGTSTMTITVTNPAANPGSITGVAISDSYSGGLVNSGTGSVACSGAGSATLTGGANAGTAVGFNTGTIVAGGTCTITQTVTTNASYTNTTGAPTGTGPVALTGTAASATLTATQQTAPTVVKSFSPTQIETGGSATLTITLTNPSANTIAINGVAFTDTFPTSPAQMTVAGVITSNCGGSTGVINTNKGISLSGGTIPANGSCYVSVPVTASTIGTYTNTTTTITSSNAATAAAASGQLVVAAVAAPTVTKSFSPSQVGQGLNSQLTISIYNPNSSISLTGVSFTDSFPSGMQASSPSGISTGAACGAAATVAADNLSVTLSGGTIAAKSTCTITLNVNGPNAGSYLNSLTVSTTNAGSKSASGTLNVLQPPAATVQFAPTMTLVNSATVLTFTLSNPNTIPITGLAFTDSYPGNLYNFSSASTTCSAVSTICNCSAGTVTAAANGTSLILSGVTLSGGATCTVNVNVAATATGSYQNSSGSVAISTTNAGSASAAPASMVVTGTPVLSVVKTANPTTGKPGDVITYTGTVTNPSGGYATTVVVSDTVSPYTAFGLNSYGSGAPFQFNDGATPSGVTMGTPVYSSDNGSTWTYTPTSGGGGASAGYDAKVTNWKIPMTGTMNPSGASFSVTYKVQIR
ncbi:DUF7933 domain-containing protein [Geomonas sp. Red276]